MNRRCSLAMACLLLFAAPPAGAVGTAPAEPAAYRQDNYREPTPATVNGKPPTTTADAHRLWEARSALFVDVLPAPRRQGGLASGTVCAPLPRLDIPGSIWLPDVGRGTLSPELEAWFRAELERVTAGNRAAPLVFYCLAHCWMSWNATKRALSWGYTAAQWYDEGTDGWEASGYPLAERSAPADQPR
jgi:PQQ-dependent catabolism-associated CXXCW motif protein